MVKRASAGIVMMAVACGVLDAQAPAGKPRFEVASVKPATPPEQKLGSGIRRVPGPRVPDPSLFLCGSCTLTGLIGSAFQLQEFLISGPEWLESERFDVTARVPPGTTAEQLRQMQQSLLEDRFHLTSHHEAKDLSRFELVVAKGGPKLKPSAGAPAPGDGREPGANITGNGLAQAKYSDLSMDDLAVILSRLVHQPVTNSTALNGRFDFTLMWDMQAPPQAGPEAYPDIFGALSSQLGLKLEQKKGLVDRLIVDHIDKVPTGN